MRLRQVAVAATALEPFRSQVFSALGLDADFRDPGVGEFGLENSVMAIGDTFFEIVAPVTDNTAAGRSLARRNASLCGYMALFQVDDFDQFQKKLEQDGIRRVWNVERPEVSACHVHPKDIGGAIVSFDEMRPAEEWVWGGPDWRHNQARHAALIRGCVLTSPHPHELARRWADILGVPLSVDGETLRLECTESYIDVVTGPYEEISTVIIEQNAGSQLDDFVLGDFTLRFVDPSA